MQPRAIEYAPPTPAELRSAGALASGLVAAVVLVSFRPFESEVDPTVLKAASGDIVNQLGFGILGVACAILLSRFAPPKNLGAFAHPLWLIQAPLLLYAIANADDPNGAFRAMIFTLIVVAAAVVTVALPRSRAELVDTLAIGIGTALAFCYFAVFFVPEQGVHQPVGPEAFHAGLWRGVYDHKNVASYVASGFALVSIFVARYGRPRLGLVMVVASLIFVWFAGSKTVVATLPVAFGTVAVANYITWRPLKVMVVLLPLTLLIVATLGAVLYPPILKALQAEVPGLTYTGRTDLWIFGLEYLETVPWTGFGYDSFWATPRIAGLEQPIELAWDVRGIVHGHNSWVDNALTFGIPGALVSLLVLVVLPLVDYARIPRVGMAGRLAGLYMGIWLLCALGANLESFFYRRSDPIWFMMLIAIAGLRVTAHRTAGQNRRL